MNVILVVGAGVIVFIVLTVVGGGVPGPSVGLAAVGGVAYADLARRGLAEWGGSGDWTDWWVSVAFLAVLVGASWDLGQRGLPGALWIFTGLGLIGSGVSLRAVSARTLGPEFRVKLAARPDQQLVRSGAYRWLRHPNYSALVAIALGTAVSTASPAALAGALGVWMPLLLLSIHREERLLAERFGEEFESWSRKTWRLVPGLY